MEMPSSKGLLTEELSCSQGRARLQPSGKLSPNGLSALYVVSPRALQYAPALV